MAAWLYPADWRRRYGVEFQCLLDDTSPRWRDLLDVLLGGLQMRFMAASKVQIVAVCALIGAAPALVVSVRLPDRYMADAEIVANFGPNTPASPDQINELTNRAFAYDRLVRIIHTYHLYHDGASRLGTPLNSKILGLYPKSMDEAVEQIRLAIRVERTGRPNGFRLSFNSTEPAQAAQITNQLSSLLVDGILRNTPTSGGALKIAISPARIPEKPYRPNRPAIVTFGALCGAMLGLMIALLRRPPMQLAS
jgi:hypothetical protein